MSLDRARDLDTALQSYAHVEGLIAHVRNACGADPDAEISGQVRVRAFVVRAEDEVFSTFVLCDDGFVVAEMNRSGETLAVWIDSPRIRRVVELRSGGEVTLTIELDADASRITLESEEMGGARGDAEGYVARQSSRGTVWPAVYEIRGPVTDPELSWMARQLRRPNG